MSGFGSSGFGSMPFGGGPPEATPSFSPSAPTAPAPPAPVVRRALTFGLARPFARDARWGFRPLADIELAKSRLGQLLAMDSQTPKTDGELPWDPERGAAVHLLRQRLNDPTAQQAAKVYVVDAISRWEPTIRVKGVRFERLRGTPSSRGEDALAIHVRFDVVTRAGAVVVSDAEHAVRL